jgi:hypothetical protein
MISLFLLFSCWVGNPQCTIFRRLKEASQEGLSTHESVNVHGASFSLSHHRMLTKTLSAVLHTVKNDPQWCDDGEEL